MRNRTRLLAAVVAVLFILAAWAYGADALRRFDKVALGPTTFSTGVLNLAPGTTAAKGIYFGKDVTLYRSAANTLKTDDDLYAAGNITAGGVLVATTDPSVTTLAVSGVTALNGATTFGNASTDTFTCTGRLILRTVGSDPLHATPGSRPAGSVGEIALYADRVYLCTNAATPVWIVVGPPV